MTAREQEEILVRASNFAPAAILVDVERLLNEIQRLKNKARLAALLAIVELDSIQCGCMAPCVGPVERAISQLLSLTNRTASEEDWSAQAELDAMVSGPERPQ